MERIKSLPNNILVKVIEDYLDWNNLDKVEQYHSTLYGVTSMLCDDIINYNIEDVYHLILTEIKNRGYNK